MKGCKADHSDCLFAEVMAGLLRQTENNDVKTLVLGITVIVCSLAEDPLQLAALTNSIHRRWGDRGIDAAQVLFTEFTCCDSRAVTSSMDLIKRVIDEIPPDAKLGITAVLEREKKDKETP